MDSRLPAQLQPLLEDYLRSLSEELPGFVTALYLHGSIALDAFNEHLSDIDFIAFLSRPCAKGDLVTLGEIHQSIAIKHPRWALEGSYLQWSDLGKLEETMTPAPAIHDGKLKGAQRFDVNSVTWWVIKNRGVALLGPQPHQLDLEVDWELLVQRMKQNLNSYWVTYTKKPDHVAWLFTDYGVQWTVLGVLRQYYSFVEGEITSKTGAGEYALVHLPAKWHRLIGEALRIRQKQAHSLYKSKIVRGLETYHFLKYIIRFCNSLP